MFGKGRMRLSRKSRRWRSGQGAYGEGYTA